ncbi:MAG TPA: hypothetical protein PK431_13975 [Chitinophagales bacterium]|nr:hypothetical protein [Chitinophagales bacterium]
MREYTMLVSKGFKDYFDAVLQDQFNPSEANKERLKQLQDENTASLIKSQQKAEIEFLGKYSKETLEFIRSISKEYFLVGSYILHWGIKSDDNDDYWEVRFNDGQFEYVLSICGGYAGTEILERNLTFERVLELLNSTPNGAVSDTTEAK